MMEPVSKTHERTNFVADPGRIADLAAQIRSGELAPAALVRSYLDRMDEVEPAIQAWCDVLGDQALAEADRLGDEAREGQFRGPLHGIPVAIKDIIDVAGRPTRAGSRSRADIAPSTADAEVVAALRTAGAVILGKTHTTEFAYFDPGPTCNPHNTGHTPGGSSSGSAAAVAAGMVPLSLGTQTAGSVNRPAAYCGIAAFKPSTLLLSTFGVVPLSAFFDTVGCYGYRVADAVALFEALCPAHARIGRLPDARTGPLDVVVIDDPLLEEGTAAVAAAVDGTARRLSEAGHRVRRAASPVPFATIIADHMLVMEHEVGRAQRALLDQPQGMVGARLLEAITRGAATTDDAYLAARRGILAAREAFWAAFAGVDAFLFPAAPTTAPEGIHATGDPKFILPWTSLGGPVVTLPAGIADDGLPLGVLVAGRPGGDWEFTGTAGRLAEAAEI